MNDINKLKYYKLIDNKDYYDYEIVGKVLAQIEDILIKNDNIVSKAILIDIIEPLKDKYNKVYYELLNDINSGIIYQNN